MNKLSQLSSEVTRAYNRVKAFSVHNPYGSKLTKEQQDYHYALLRNYESATDALIAYRKANFDN